MGMWPSSKARFFEKAMPLFSTLRKRETQDALQPANRLMATVFGALVTQYSDGSIMLTHSVGVKPQLLSSAPTTFCTAHSYC